MVLNKDFARHHGGGDAAPLNNPPRVSAVTRAQGLTNRSSGRFAPNQFVETSCYRSIDDGGGRPRTEKIGELLQLVAQQPTPFRFVLLGRCQEAYALFY